MPPTANKLDDVDVDRLDAVDDPASGRKWLIAKFTDDNQESTMDAAKLEQATITMIEALKADAEGGMLRVGQKSADAISEAMKSLGIDGAVKAYEEPAEVKDPPADATPTEPVGDPPADDAAKAKAKKEEPPFPPKDEDEDDEEMKAKKQVAELAAAVKSLSEEIASLKATKSEGDTETVTEPAAKPDAEPAPASTQAAGTDTVQKRAPKKLGEGVFTSLFQK